MDILKQNKIHKISHLKNEIVLNTFMDENNICPESNIGF